jgi:CTP:phosphocholine cytidylyltransferase-like protein/thiamine kinase-like enzyme
MTKPNAIILAAGRSQAFAPFSYEKPKGLFEVNGKPLVERQIEQLHDAGIEDIHIVVGFMKEKFFYLQKKYGVDIIFNNGFDNNGNLVSLLLAKDYLESTYVCCADHYFQTNPFSTSHDMSCAYRACEYRTGEFSEFSATIGADGLIDTINMGGSDSYCMVGEAYFSPDFSRAFIDYANAEIDNFGVRRMFWEEFWLRHSSDLPLAAKIIDADSFREFDSLEEIARFDKSFLDSIDSQIVENITELLECKRSEIEDIEILNKGLSNVLFLFTVRGTRYVYRHPGGSSDNFANRASEKLSEQHAKALGLDETCIYVDKDHGWKISRFVSGAHDFTYKNKIECTQILQMLRKLHTSTAKTPYEFDVLRESDKLMRLACNTKGDLFQQFKPLRNKMVRLYHFIESDEVPKVLCHNDCYAPNFLVNGEVTYLIDWEFSAMGDPANDFGGIVSREHFEDEEVAWLLETYFGRRPTTFERRHYYGFVALTGYYFFCWSLFKDSIGEDSGHFMLNAYNNAEKYYESTINDYLNPGIDVTLSE